MGLPTAGEAALAELERQSVPTAIMFLDACRLDLGQRLAGLLNKGEPVQRATIAIAAAPVPSVTAIGMPFALPMTREALTVLVAGANSDLTVMAKDFAGDLARLDQRRQWLEKNVGIKDHLAIDEVLDGETLKKPSKSRKIIAVYGAEFDRHDGELQLTGADAHLDRYVQAIRRLRDNGYSRVIVVTDHGFFHWDPEDHEIADKPAGKLLWMSRRAIVGRNLSHPQAVHLRVPCSDLEVMVPRSMHSFKTYGGLEFFHGGASLQEVVIPVVVVMWPAKAKKVSVVLKPVGNIASLTPRVQVQAGAAGQKTMFAESDMLGRQVLIKVKDPIGGKVIFKHREPVTVEPNGEPLFVPLEIVDPRPELAYNSPLEVLVVDADDEELLTREDITLKVEINDWN